MHEPPVNEFITNEPEKLENAYRRIRESTDDVPKIAEELDLHDDDPAKLAELEEMVDVAKRNVFVNKRDVAVGPGEIRHGNFTPLQGIADLWTAVMDGKYLTGPQVNELRSLIAHEYVEAKLLEDGVPYNTADPRAWPEDGPYRPARPGPHELAPLSLRSGAQVDLLRLWKHYGLTSPFPDGFLAKDLSKANLDEIVRAMKEQMGW